MMRWLIFTLLFPAVLIADVRRPIPASLAPFRKPGQPYAVNYVKRPMSRPAVYSARVMTKNFKPINKSLGEWSGIVHGTGKVHLGLQILRNGRVESTRYIGNVELQDKSSTFHFRSPIPYGPNWTWNIIAFL